jgi:hypothetical protein
VHGRVAGDVMVDGSSRGERLRPLGLGWIAARGRGSRSLRELAGRLGAIWEVVGLAERVGTVDGLADGFARVGAGLAQGVETATGELARDRHRRPGVREPARLQREVVGVVGALGPTCRLGRLIQRPAQLRRALLGQLAGPRAPVGAMHADIEAGAADCPAPNTQRYPAAPPRRPRDNTVATSMPARSVQPVQETRAPNSNPHPRDSTDTPRFRFQAWLRLRRGRKRLR